MGAASVPWSPDTHEVWPRSFRSRGVLTLLCVARNIQGRAWLPKEVVLHCLGFCAREWFDE